MKPGENPIDRVVWVDAETLTANAWNPNAVLRAELRLLELSILSTGWVQPILVTPTWTIIDGFHRWNLAQDSKPLRTAFGAKVPVCVLDVTEAEGIMLTVRMNRAKGTHQAVRMAALVKLLVEEHGCTEAEVALGIGAAPREVRLLLQDDLFKARKLADAPYSKAWVPIETKAKGKGAPGP